MSSPRRIAASRANGCHSKGPVTSEGKERSSQNSLRHGLLAGCLVLAAESREAFDIILREHLHRLKPVDGVELGMVEEMVAALWRMRRAWAIETRLLEDAPDPGADSQPTDLLDGIVANFVRQAGGPALPLLHRYQARLHLTYRRALNNLRLLRSAFPNEPSPNSEHLPEPIFTPPPAPPPIQEPAPTVEVETPPTPSPTPAASGQTPADPREQQVPPTPAASQTAGPQPSTPNPAGPFVTPEEIPIDDLDIYLDNIQIHRY